MKLKIFVEGEADDEVKVDKEFYKYLKELLTTALDEIEYEMWTSNVKIKFKKINIYGE